MQNDIERQFLLELKIFWENPILGSLERSLIQINLGIINKRDKNIAARIVTCIKQIQHEGIFDF
jgi:hypothetical protein